MPDGPSLSPNGSTLAILDANVLLPMRLSDLLFDLHLEGLYSAHWTKAIEAEVKRNFGTVVVGKGSANRKALRTGPLYEEHLAKAERRLKCFRGAAPLHEVFLYDTEDYLSKVPSKVHKGDKHVASAALVLSTLAKEEKATNKVFIVSSNTKHMAVQEMAKIDVTVVTPGVFIDLLHAASPDIVEKALMRTVKDLKAPPFTKEDVLGLLTVHRAKKTAEAMSAKWKIKIPNLAKTR